MPRTSHGDLRRRILDAAEERLWHSGFKKTTIDEIAADAGVGKGTVYLYFDSKEDIALAIMEQFKETNLEDLRKIAQDDSVTSLEKLKEILISPVVLAHRRCLESPSAQEMIIAVRPQIRARMQPYYEQEIVLIGQVLQEGNQNNAFAVEDTLQAARTLKTMCAGFWPPYPVVEGVAAIETEIRRIVDLVFCGLRPAVENNRLCACRMDETE